MSKTIFWLIRYVSLVVFNGSLSLVAFADQNAPELDELFVKLQRTTDLTEIANIQSTIWYHWYEVPGDDESLQMLFDSGAAASKIANLGLAVEQFTKLVDRAPDFAEGWNRRATSHFMSGNIEASIYDIQRTLALEPRHFGALSGLSMIFEIRGDFDLAIKAELGLLELMPHNKTIVDRIDALEKRAYTAGI